MDPKLEYLLSLCTRSPGGRLVSSKDLIPAQIAEAQGREFFYIDADGNGFAFLPWSLTTQKDREREQDFLGAQFMNKVLR